MISYRARWVLPIAAPPIRDGWVAVDDGRVVGVGAGSPPAGSERIDVGSVAVMPGLVNAHTHLELSYLRDRVPRASDFISWVRPVIALQRGRSDPSSPEVVAAIGAAIDESVRSGTAVVGDISNTLTTFAPLAESPLAAVVFHELIRFNTDDPDGIVAQAQRTIDALPATRTVRASLAAHAPYSVAPLVLRAIRAASDADPRMRCSVHLSESAEEVEFIRHGGGPWRALLEELGAWNRSWVPPGGSPVEYLEACGFLGDRVLAVHGVQMSPADLEHLAARGVTLVTCPRSNTYTGAGTPPVEDFYASGVRVAIGTDSLASTPDLNMFAELTAVRALASSVPAARLLDSATRQGARALGFEDEFGTIEPGRSARLIAVAIPAGVEDVEEYLVGGIEPDRVRWLESEI